MTYDVAVDDPELADAAVEDGVLVVRGRVSGQVSVTVTATAGDGADAWRASRTFVLAVRGQALVPFFPRAADAAREGFVRVVNRSAADGAVRISAIDGAGVRHGPATLRVGAGAAAAFNSRDLEDGNVDKGLPTTADGFVTSVHDIAPGAATRRQVAIFNPGSNTAQVSHLRVVKPERGGRGRDRDRGRSATERGSGGSWWRRTRMSP